MGTPDLAVPTLDAVHEAHELVGVATQPDRRSGRGRAKQPSPVKRRAAELGVPVLQPSTLRAAEAVAALEALHADVVVVVAYGLLLPTPVLEMPRLGCVNLHASLLPRHRGASPVQAAILAGDTVTGNTMILMDEGLDTGPILLAEPMEILADDTAASLGSRLAVAGAVLVTRSLAGLTSGALAPRPQPDEGVTVTRKIRKENGRIDWRLPAGEIERLVRAMQPWPTAFTQAYDQRLQVWAAALDEGVAAVPGTVLTSDRDLRVACGDGTALRLLEVQRAGSRRMSAAEFLRGSPIAVGTRLGDPE